MHPVAVITGGASGIGLATARRLREAGRRVALLDIDLTRCRLAAEQLGDGVAAFECNVVDEGNLSAVAGRVEADLGPIEALVCGAGAPQVPGPVDAMAIDEWQTVVDSHPQGHFPDLPYLRPPHGRTRPRCYCQHRLGHGPCTGAHLCLRTEQGRRHHLDDDPGGGVGPQGCARKCRGSRLDRYAVSHAQEHARQSARHDSAGQRQPARPTDGCRGDRRGHLFLLSPQSSAIIGCTVPCDGGFLASRGWAPYGGVPQS